MNLQQKVFSHLYRRAPSVEALPWHRDQPPELLRSAIGEHPTGGRALDLGCGEGVYSVHLAQQGFSVVGVDFVPAALAAARDRAARAGVTIDFREADVDEFESTEPFDVVLDSGCLHHLPKAKALRYPARLDDWLAPDGDFVLVHFSHRPRVGWIPKGPNHLTKAQATKRFPYLQLQAYDETVFEVPLPMGNMRAGIYWFKRR